MAEIGPIQRNPVLGAASDGLRTIKTGLNKVPLPQWAGGGLGNLMLGDAPEEIHNWSQGFSPFYDMSYGGGNNLLRVRPERAQGVMDAMLLPVGEAIGAAKLTGKGLRGMASAANRAVSGTGTAMGRREFLKNAGGAAAGVGAAAAVPSVVRKVMHAAEGAAPDLLKAGAKAAVRATPHEYYGAIRAAQKAAYEARLAAQAPFDHAVERARRADYDDFLQTDQGQRWLKSGYVHDEYDWADVAPTDRWDAAQVDRTNAGWRAYNESYGPAEKAIKGDSKYKGYLSEDELDTLFHTEPDAFEKYMESIGRLSDDDVLTALQRGSTHVDPISGLHAELDEYGQLVWRDPETGWKTRYRHWTRSF